MCFDCTVKYTYINILCSRPIFGLLGLTVEQNWVEVTELKKYIYMRKHPERNEKENQKKRPK